MACNGADFTLTFRRLCDAAAVPDGDAAVRSLFTDPIAFDDWAGTWRHRHAEEGGEANERQAAMRGANPAFIAQPSGGGGDLCSREQRGLFALREFADGALQAFRGSTSL